MNSVPCSAAALLVVPCNRKNPRINAHVIFLKNFCKNELGFLVWVFSWFCLFVCCIVVFICLGSLFACGVLFCWKFFVCWFGFGFLML